MKISHSLEADAQLYVAENIQKPPFDCLAYVVAMEAPPGHPYANHVIIVPNDARFGTYLFTPDRCLEGMPYERVIRLALESYVSAGEQRFAVADG